MPSRWLSLVLVTACAQLISETTSFQASLLLSTKVSCGSKCNLRSSRDLVARHSRSNGASPFPAAQGKSGAESSDCQAENGGDSGLLFHVAPMQCYTNRHLRYFYRLLSSKSVLWTEMEKVEDLLESDEACHRRLQNNDVDPVILQLGGNDANLLKKAAQRGFSYGFNELNLNCGCPSVSSGGSMPLIIPSLCDTEMASAAARCKLRRCADAES
eukprot:270586-Rhodomonas_salina.1